MLLVRYTYEHYYGRHLSAAVCSVTCLILGRQMPSIGLQTSLAVEEPYPVVVIGVGESSNFGSSTEGASAAESGPVFSHQLAVPS